jgi:hypothetical protein
MPEHNYVIRQGLSIYQFDYREGLPSDIFIFSDVSIYVGPDDILSGPEIQDPVNGGNLYTLIFTIQQVSGVSEAHEERRITPVPLANVKDLEHVPADYAGMRSDLRKEIAISLGKDPLKPHEPGEFKIQAVLMKDGEPVKSETNVISENEDIEIHDN